MEIAPECFQALVDCHTGNACRHLQCSERTSQSFEAILGSNSSSGSHLSVSRVAQLFAQEADRCLSRDEFIQLLVFLKNPKANWRKTKEQLHKSVTERLESFYSHETAASGQNRDRLATPGGPPDADLGLILHIQSEEDAIGPFWDPRSVTIRLLEEKGLNGNFCFGYDWHWRAEETFHGRTDCPVHKWSRDLTVLHHILSSDILKILPLPFIISASSCTRKNIRKTLSKQAKHLEIPIAPPVGVLRFDLDFRNGALRRIILHIHHPCAGFFAGKTKKSGMAMQIDTGIEFMLWLTGQKYALNVFSREYFQSVPRLRKAAPLAQMYSYLRKEREEHRLLKLEEYTPCFLNWAGRYLQTDPAFITSRGESIAVAAVKKIGRRITEALHRKRGTNKELIASAKHHSSFDSTSKRPETGFSKGFRRKRKRATSLAISTGGVDEQQLEVIQPITVTTPTDGQRGISIGHEERSRTQGDCNEPHSSDSSEVVDDQQTKAFCSPSPDRVTVPLPTLQGGKALFQDNCNELQSSDPSMIADDQETDTPYGIPINEVAIPMPIDDHCDQIYPQETCPENGDQEDDLEGLGVTVFHGCPVRLLQNGVVQLNGPSHRSSLRFRMSNKEAKRILELKKAPTIHFTLEEIRLHIDNDVVYRKPIERLLGSKEGPGWLIQITREFENLFQDLPEKGGAEGPTEGNELTVTPHSTSAGTYWKNGELQRKLRQGASFPCRPLTNGTNMGRVCFRGVQLLVPKTANFATVQIQCDLVAGGLQHSNPCATKTRDKDPAARLGIKLKFMSVLDGEMQELWATLGGEGNTKKINSLVDFLDGNDEQWTEQQPRRFLDKNKGRGRTKPLYTS